VKAGVAKSGGVKCEGRRARLSGDDSLGPADVSKRKRVSTVTRVECGVVLFRILYNYIRRESNGGESWSPHQCHSA
jgi:hypothetical protein